MKNQFEHNSQTYSVELTPTGKSYLAAFGEQTSIVEIIHAENGQLNLLINGQPVSATVSSDGAKRWVTVDGQTFVLTKPAGGAKRGGHSSHTSDELISPMPGQVRAVQVVEGDSVTKGQTLVVVEAMKMEIKIAAPRDGTVKTLKVMQGQTVEKDQTLIEMESSK